MYTSNNKDTHLVPLYLLLQNRSEVVIIKSCEQSCDQNLITYYIVAGIGFGVTGRHWLTLALAALVCCSVCVCVCVCV